MAKSVSHALKIDKHLLLKRDLASYDNRIVSEMPSDVSIVEVNSQNIEDVLDFRDESVLREFRNFYAADGCYGAYAYLEGVCIGHLWVQINNTKVCRLSQEGILLLPGEGGVFYGNVSEEYRGKRIGPGIFNKNHEQAKSLGCERLINHVLTDNEASLRVNQRIGGIVSETRATVLDTASRLIVIYKSDDRWFVFLRLLWLKKGIVLAWSKAYKFALILAKL